MLVTSIWLIIKQTGRFIMMTGAFAGRNRGEVFPVVTAAAKLIDENGKEYCAIAKEALYDSNPRQKEALLSSHHCKANPANAIDETARTEFDIDGQPGRQLARFDNTQVPFHFDGNKGFYEIKPITPKEMEKLPRIYLTSAEEDEQPYEPIRQHTVRLTKRSAPKHSYPWKWRLGFFPDNVIDKTLQATTQMVSSVEAEQREKFRDHFATRLPSLKCKRVNDILCVDTFFSSVTSIRGYTCFNLYAYVNSMLDSVQLMTRRKQPLPTLQTVVTRCGAPHTVKTDNAPEFKSKAWTTWLHARQIDLAHTEANHSNQNPCERRGGMLKAATTHLLTVTKAPIVFWCYALEYISLVYSFIARRQLGWRSPHEAHFGDTPDISLLRYPFYCPIWYYVPSATFPHSKMLPGRFLGIAATQGDAFTFLVLTWPDGDNRLEVLSRSVIRRRYPREEPPEVHEDILGNLKFTKSNGMELQTPEDQEDLPLPTESMLPSDTPNSTLTHEEDDPVEAYFEAIEEVYGPEVKRVKLSSPEELQETTETPQNVSTTTDTNSASTNHNVHPERDEILVETIDVNEDCESPITTGPSDDDPEDVDSLPAHPLPTVTQDYSDNEHDDDSSTIIEDTTTHLQSLAGTEVDDEGFRSIVGHEWDNGVLQLRCKFDTGEESLLPFTIVRRDHPYVTAHYILDNAVGSHDGKFTTGRHTRWARALLRQCRRTVRRILTGYQNVSLKLASGQKVKISENLEKSVLIRRTFSHRRNTTTSPSSNTKKKKKNPGRLSRGQPTVKYGVKIPRNTKEARTFDDENGNHLWQEAAEKEIATLLSLGCFEFYEPHYKPPEEYQYVKLKMIYEVKNDGRRKGRLVAEGQHVDPRGLSLYSSVVKTISVRLLDIIADRDGLEILCGDVGNAFVTANCLEKVYSRAGPEFGDKEDAILILSRALYGLRSSSRAFRLHFSDFLRSQGFFPCRFDRDVWMRMREDNEGYDYICTHVDDFKVCAKDPKRWINAIANVFLLKSSGPPDYYLGNDYGWTPTDSKWVVGCATYIKECVRKLEEDDLIDGNLIPQNTPMPDDCHPELDNSQLLDPTGIRKYQMLIGMAQWANQIGRLDICFAVSSLSRFSTCPREGHLQLAVRLFGYLKKYANRRIVVNSEPFEFDDDFRKNSFHPDFLEDYPDAHEEIDSEHPTARGKELHVCIFFDADHAHDQKTRRSITGMIVFVGQTPVQWTSKRQGCIATSTYCAEFVAMRSAVEEAIGIRYILRSLGIPVTQPVDLIGDNFGVIQSANIPESEMKKKHIAISYHFVREAIAAKIVNGLWCTSAENFSDVCTKALGRVKFFDIVMEVMR